MGSTPSDLRGSGEDMNLRSWILPPTITICIGICNIGNDEKGMCVSCCSCACLTLLDIEVVLDSLCTAVQTSSGAIA